jgi:hypothetical protein
MKTPLNRNRILVYLRTSAGCVFFAAAAALAFVATTTTNVQTVDNAAAKKRLPVAKLSMQDSVKGVGAEKYQKGKKGSPSFESPLTRAEEEAAKRAYPADSTPFTAQLNAIIGYKRFMATSAVNATPTPVSKGGILRKNKKQPPETPRFNTWFPIGPAPESPVPNILTFTGSTSAFSGRITALEIDRASGCSVAFCRVWLGAAGGGVWRTTNALAPTPTWTFLTSLNVMSNAIGALFYDNAHGVLYAGTGEPNASADSEAGLGLMRSNDGGDSWTALPCLTGPLTTFSPGTGPNGTYTGNAFFGRAISKIVVDPTNFLTIYVASTRAVRGVDSTYGGPTSNPPVPRPAFGLYKSVDGGGHFTLIWDGGASCPAICIGVDPLASIRGVPDLKLDPINPSIVYASAFPGPGGGGGVWRSTNGGITWTQILAARDPANNDDRTAFDVHAFGVDTLMMAAQGNTGTPTAHVFRSLAAETAVLGSFTDLTAVETPAGQTDDYCDGQCWYDNYVVIPPEAANITYVGGSFSYGTFNGATNGRNVIATQFATNAAPATVTWFDFTDDAVTNPTPPGSCCQPNAISPNGMHPDAHALVTIPGIPTFFFAGNDGGIWRSDSGYSNISGQCVARIGVTIFTLGDFLLCQQLLTAVPTVLDNLNQGLADLQFHSLAVDANNPFHVQGGTQDNGTMELLGSFNWPQIIYGDGAQSGINILNSALRFNSFFFQFHDGNFRNGSPPFWVVIAGPIAASPEGSLFAPPIINDPTFAFANTIFQGSRHVWRTQDWGGSQVFLETNCPEFTTSGANPLCGDFLPLGGPAGNNTAGDLEGTFYGADRTGGAVNVIERTPSSFDIAWAAGQAGRVFISTNVNTAPAASVIWNRVDPHGAVDPSRVVTGIAIDPLNPFHAWVSYSGYNFNTPSQPGHLFSVTWPGGGPAVWTNISFNLPDIPLTSVVFDPVKGDLYVSSDFTVFRLKAGTTIWDVSGIGLPIVEVSKLTIFPSPLNPNTAFLYAATHGLSAWVMPLYRP